MSQFLQVFLIIEATITRQLKDNVWRSEVNPNFIKCNNHHLQREGRVGIKMFLT